MASVTTRPNGSRFITFRDARGAARHITLGQVQKRYADAVKVRVEDLAAAALHGHSPTDETCRWLSTLEERLYSKLVAVGLVPDRQNATIGELVSAYISEREGELKPESIRKLRQTEVKLLEFFDKDRPARQIAVEEAVAWRRSLKDLGLSEAAIRTHSGNAKTMLAEAKRRKAIDANPFETLRSGSTPSKYTRYVTPDEIDRVIDACPDSEWRLAFGLARYAGLRVPSETQGLTWADVDFERGRLTVHSPKTERWEGHGQRVVPITPKLMALLQERFDSMPEGEPRLVTIGGKGAVIRRVRRIWAAAGVEPWARLWQTLRSSCEKEWAMTYPQFAVSKWIGHSITISGKHYANSVPDELFDRAASATPTTAAPCAQRQAQRKASETAGKQRKSGNAPTRRAAQNDADLREIPRLSASCR
ncbi:MAG: tyrosine-type recombinase/integrase [Phycisphaeraceae bacterium]|nr:tyrosine-type recombinase/integrase [Phycisphaeraceae bacterium]